MIGAEMLVEPANVDGDVGRARGGRNHALMIPPDRRFAPLPPRGASA